MQGKILIFIISRATSDLPTTLHRRQSTTFIELIETIPDISSKETIRTKRDERFVAAVQYCYLKLDDFVFSFQILDQSKQNFS